MPGEACPYAASVSVEQLRCEDWLLPPGIKDSPQRNLRLSVSRCSPYSEDWLRLLQAAWPTQMGSAVQGCAVFQGAHGCVLSPKSGLSRNGSAGVQCKLVR